MKVSPLLIFVGLSAVAIIGLGVINHDKWYPGFKDSNQLPKTVDIISRDATLFPKKRPDDKNNANATGNAAARANTADVTKNNPLRDEQAEFDIVRIEPDGSAVIAGRSKANAKIALKLNGDVVGASTANDHGEWLVVPDQAIAKGEHELTIEVDGKAATGDKPSVMVSVPDKSEDESLVVSAAKQPVANEPKAPEATTKTPTKTPIKSIAAPATKETQNDTNFTMDTVHYDNLGGIVFTGKSRPGMIVRMFIDGQHLRETTSNAQGDWRIVGRNDVTAGNHNLRIDEMTPERVIKKRLDMPIFRLDPAKAANLMAAQQPEPDGTEKVAQQAAISTNDAPPNSTDDTQADQKITDIVTPTAAPAVVATTNFNSPPNIDASPNAAEPQMTDANKVIIQPGNNLWNISRVIYGKGMRYTTIYEANKKQIDNPNLIYPGQVFSTPGVAKNR